ncbi:unnamed protein product [Miscanthus lutarioriparius]|uniref:Cytochrome P450 n=1 Tax=Miscanthus lutarioriparius TaxID=422564 RepID=A0A811P4H5_9POAL|nr:unnamed protein product [Miscanthus lutarioriparius]
MDAAAGSADAPLLLLAVSSLVILTAIQSRRRRVLRGAPSPPSLPLLGHLHLLGYPLHRALASLAVAQGRPGVSAAAPVLSLRLGARRALLVSAHAAAVECFTERDAALAGRPRLLARGVLGYGCTDILWASYGDHWWTLRRFFSAELLSASRLAARAADRRAEVAALVDNLLRDATDGATPLMMVTLRPRLFEFVINVMLRALIGVSLHGSDAARWQEIVEESVRLNAAPSVGDLYPALRWAILQGGTGTSMLTIEWAMAQLLLHPEAMKKVRAEIDTHVRTARLVEESDIASLPYLQCVVKETLRLRPVGPIIPAHEAMEDCTVGGFHVRWGTMILVNAWAIQRDPAAAWDAPDEFMPERFLDDGGKVTTAAAVPMLPFGVGRRRCPAEAMAMRLVSSMVAALVQCFEWDVGEGRTIDMTEGGGLSMPMATPLAAVCRPREFVKSMLSAST